MDDLQAHPVPDRHSISRARVAVRDLSPMPPAMTTRGNPLQIDTKCLLDPWQMPSVAVIIGYIIAVLGPGIAGHGPRLSSPEPTGAGQAALRCRPLTGVCL
jgi:hypothetical protein